MYRSNHWINFDVGDKWGDVTTNYSPAPVPVRLEDSWIGLQCERTYKPPKPRTGSRLCSWAQGDELDHGAASEYVETPNRMERVQLGHCWMHQGASLVCEVTDCHGQRQGPRRLLTNPSSEWDAFAKALCLVLCIADLERRHVQLRLGKLVTRVREGYQRRLGG